ncbi:HpcH/HpaI aldolase/citrate lyase family protein [Yoonia sp. R2331]|uniref:HpcH/HpaI aldolase family protein n=1 Tax=Yoonia sp. R2331 TaxID=3237238 RepID=UPI0034E5D379
MKMPTNAFKAALKAKKKQVGLWVSTASPMIAEIVAGAGYDWLCVDMEHSPGDVMTAMTQLQAIAPHTSAIVRPPWNDTVVVKRLLDIGAPGLLFPMVQTVTEAEAAVAATRYPPEGVRGVAGAMRGSQWGRYSDYGARVADETVVILQVETLSAMAIADQIAAVNGVDGVFFGPADIAADMGMLGQPLHADVWAKIMPVAQKLMNQGVPVGTLVTDPALATELLNKGFTFVAVATDTGLLAKAADGLLAQVKAGMEG